MIRPELIGMRGYVEGPRQRIDLASNTNQFHPPNPQVPVADCSAYPPAPDTQLIAAAARAYGVKPTQVLPTAGSDQALDLLMRACLQPGDVMATPTPTFGMAALFAKANHGRVVTQPLDEQGNLDVATFASTPAQVRYLCRPNNPTGTSTPREQIEALLRSDGLLIVDEAYAEYADDDVLSLVGHPRLIVLRTLSKAYGVAGARVGFALGPEELIAALGAIGGPYLVNVWSREVACAVLADQPRVDATIDATHNMRPKWDAALQQLGFKTLPSQANFIYAKPPIAGTELVEGLWRHEIGIRHFPDAEMVRITIGPQPILDAFEAAAREVLGA